MNLDPKHLAYVEGAKKDRDQSADDDDRLLRMVCQDQVVLPNVLRRMMLIMTTHSDLILFYNSKAAPRFSESTKNNLHKTRNLK